MCFSHPLAAIQQYHMLPQPHSTLQHLRTLLQPQGTQQVLCRRQSENCPRQFHNQCPRQRQRLSRSHWALRHDRNSSHSSRATGAMLHSRGVHSRQVKGGCSLRASRRGSTSRGRATRSRGAASHKFRWKHRGLDGRIHYIKKIHGIEREEMGCCMAPASPTARTPPTST